MSAQPPARPGRPRERPREIRTLLVANRGEIARRVMRTAHVMGIRTVAVHSDPDTSAPHVADADLAVPLGGASAAESYLDRAKILDAARRSGADAVHPGYGFLAENAEFAEECAAAGLNFVGPSPEAIRAMGLKHRAKQLAREAGVPVLPDGQITTEDRNDWRAAADLVGYPLMVKAVAGGGGTGMRLVGNGGHDGRALVDAVESARREAQGAFGDDRVFLERYLRGPRHVEVQVFGDLAGNVLHLLERECSIQRRHQKVVEEAPSPAVSPQLRARMGEAALALARALGYAGAGTVEFLLDQHGTFYFLEMNTRLQVEHPVTEEVTGLDLVRMQLEVAQGHPLPVSQADIAARGHAIEVRLYAENPARGFAPSFGPLWTYRHAATAREVPGIRYEDGVAAGGEISPFYDPMLGKVIAHAATRTEAALRLRRALAGMRLHGPATNRDFLVALLDDPDFLAGETSTAYIETHPGLRSPGVPGQAAGSPTVAHLVAAVAVTAHRRRAAS
ncbi:MAG: acetyl-CoA carboxylase biotin carboxylase subunit, partial [Carbonactinosporaceae bacterium]